MSLDAILQAIYAAGEEQIQQIEAQTAAKVDELMSNARLEAEQVYQQAFETAVAPASRERSRIIHRAKLEALRIVGSVREGLVDAVLQQARERLAKLRNEGFYADVFRNLVQETLAEMRASVGAEDPICLRIDRRDQALMESILAEMKLRLPIEASLECWGGLAASSEDGRVVVVNTFEARLERASPYLRRYLAALFEAEECQTSTTAMPEFAP